MKEFLKVVARSYLPSSAQQWLRIQLRNYSRWPPVGWVRLGSLRRLTPINRNFGFSPLCRYYIRNFLRENKRHIQGHVLEIGDYIYTREFGGSGVTKSDVLNVFPGNPKATIIADLTDAGQIQSDTFDCIIFTQTLQLIYDVKAVIRTLERILKPNGVILATFSGISQISRGDMEKWGDYWRFTTLSARRLFEEAFPKEHIKIQAHGNVLVAISYLHGLMVEELKRSELDFHDPDYEILITVKAVKPDKKSCLLK